MLDDDNAPAGATDDVPTRETPTGAAPDQGASEASETPDTASAEPEKKPEPWQRRIDQLTREKYDARREAEAAKREVEILRGLQGAKNPDDPQSSPPPLSQADLDKLVEQRADAKAREKAFNDECNATHRAGVAAFQDFDTSVRTINAMFGDRITRDFLDGINSLPNGHEVYHRLAHDSEEAERVLSLPPIKMAIELTRLSTAKPKQVSGAPPPVQPVNGRGRTREWNIDDADIPMTEFIRLREKQEADRRRR